ncbi:uncharacterized protein LOC107399284 isoform X3 [Tribolium castaneum]|uniref:uncharacterized protein LOC107399284 isoform X3 n=1 Tax=Tribolium castaneum TaxID=7070 RepID=UPI0030FDF7D6
MRWSTLWWFAAVLAAALLQENGGEAARTSRSNDMLERLIKLDEMYSAVARPRFGKRIDDSNPPMEYEGQYQSEDVGDWLPVRR